MISLRNIAGSKKAFTLIEVLVAMLILAIGMLGLLGITILVFRNNLLSQQITEATNINTALMDRLKSRLKVMDQAELDAINCEIGNQADTQFYAPQGCNLLESSGMNPDDYPPPRNDGGAVIDTCVVPEVLGDSSSDDWFTHIAVTSAGAESYPTANFCDEYDGSDPMTRDQYIQYYRVYDNTTPGVNNKILVTIVMWKDRFNKARFIRLDSTINPSGL